MNMKKLYAKISYNNGGSYIESLENAMNALQGEFDGLSKYNTEVGDKWTIEIIEMEEEDFESLPEFDGWENGSSKRNNLRIC
jgi:hypothetical protein